MKKVLSLASLALLGVVAITGCSCGSKGTYVFSHVEYEKDGEKVETTCENQSTENFLACTVALADRTTEYTLDGNKMITKIGSVSSETFYKIEDDEIKTHTKEDAEEYVKTGLKYKFMGKLIREFDTNNDDKPDYTIVFKKK